MILGSGGDMINTYMLIAWRSLKKHKLFSFINIIGLALAMSVGVLELIRVSDAFSYDNFHPDGNKICRIVTDVTGSNGEKKRFASSPLALANNISGDLMSTLIYPGIHSTIKDSHREFEFDGCYIEPSFFDVFGFQLLRGSPTSLSDPHHVILSEKFARKFLDEASAPGRTVTIEGLGEFEVVGIMKTPPSKSHIQYDVYVSMAAVSQAKMNDWNSIGSGYTYVKLIDNANIDVLNSDLERLSGKMNEKESRNDGSIIEFDRQALSSISPSPPDIYNDIGRSPSRGSLMAELTIVFVVLIAACFNYANLSIARTLTRGKEIGIRKLSGASRLQIIGQYIAEALLISFLALLVSNFILAPILEYQPFNDGYEMIPPVKPTWMLLLSIAGFTLFTAVLAGGIPAWILSSLRPVRVLRGVATEKLLGHLSLRKTLLVFQFSLSLFILVFLSTFYRQFDFLADGDLGFDWQNVLIIPAGAHGPVTGASLEKISDVEAVGFTSSEFGRGSKVTASLLSNDETPSTIDYYSCDSRWITMMGLKPLAGSVLLNNSSAVVLSEKAVIALGFRNDEQAIGEQVYINDSTRVTISGVVGDVYSNGFGNAVRPIMFRNDSSLFKSIAVRTSQSNRSDVVDKVKREWLKQNVGYVFDHKWLDEQLNRGSDQSATVSLLGFLGLITLSIASLGLLGLVVYTVEVKRKEIGIRKIIGATIVQLISVLSGGFVVLLLIAAFISLPLGYAASQLFLTNFVNHISTSPLQLVGSLLVLLLVGLSTILSQTINAARENPVNHLRSE